MSAGGGGNRMSGRDRTKDGEEMGVDKFQAVRPAATPQIEKLQLQAESYKKKAETERRKVSELERQIESLSLKVMSRRRKLGGPNAPRESAAQVRKQIKILDNRLEKALARHNATLAHNRQLRENIDNLRRGRLVFDSLYRKLEKELQDKKKDMIHIIEVSNRAYEAREAAVNEMARLKAQSDREQAVFEAEFKELGRLIEHDRKMRDYLKLRSKDVPEELRQSQAASAEQAKKKKDKEKAVSQSQSLSLRESQQHSAMAGLHAASSKEQMVCRSYGEAFAKIQKATGITGFEDLMTTFINAEDENYRLYKYVDTLTQEIARLEEQISDIQVEIASYRQVEEQSVAVQAEEQGETDSRLAVTLELSQNYQAKQTQADKLIDMLKVGVWNTFKRLGCDQDEETMKQVGDEGVTVRNMMLCLSLIEARTTELLQIYTVKLRPELEAAAGLEASAAGGKDKPREMQTGTVLSIEPPSTTDKVATDSEEEEEEEEDRPLSRKELQIKTLKSLHKRETAAGRRRQTKAAQAEAQQTHGSTTKALGAS